MLEILIPIILVICILFGVWVYRLAKPLDEKAKKMFGTKVIPYVDRGEEVIVEIQDETHVFLLKK